MKFVIYVINTILILGIVVYITILGIQSTELTVISTSLDIKTIKSSDLLEYTGNTEESVSDDEIDNLEQEQEEIKVQNEEENKQVVVNEDITSDDVVVTEEVSSPVLPITDVLETQIGSLSGYGPDCYGCTGFLANGLDVRNGNIYYFDSTYGNVRILAGDSSYPFGTIVRVKNSKLATFYGIILDRGSVGFNGVHLFDLLYATESEAALNGVSYNTTFEVLRYGY